jgi:hypothetical protein
MQGLIFLTYQKVVCPQTEDFGGTSIKTGRLFRADHKVVAFRANKKLF